METATISQEKLDLIKRLADESKAAESVTAAEGPKGILKAFTVGKTIRALEKLHVNYSDVHGRIFPFFEEDFETVSEETDSEGVDAAIGEVVYHWGFVADLGTGFTNFAFHLSELNNNISDLVTWHPKHNVDTGEIDA